MNLKTTLGALSIILFSQFAAAIGMGDCKKIESKGAFFDGKRKSWLKMEEIQIFDCNGSYQAALVHTQAKAELDRIGLTTPQKTEKWKLDELTCNEKNSASKIKRHKVILTTNTSHTPKAAYAINEKTKKFEVIDVASLDCP